MADVVKLVNRAVPVLERTQNFNQTDGVEGDIILVKSSLGKVASHIVIDAVAGMQVRFNVYQTTYPARKHSDGYADMQLGGFNLALAEQYQDTTMTPTEITAGTTFTIDGDFPVRDIELVVASGNYNIFTSQ